MSAETKAEILKAIQDGLYHYAMTLAMDVGYEVRLNKGDIKIVPYWDNVA